MDIDEIVYKVRGAIFEVHKTLGHGLLEEAYQKCLERELVLRGLEIKPQFKQHLVYKGVEVKDAYVIDILVEDCVVIELKSVEKLLPIHFKQLLNYLHLGKMKTGILVNFNTEFIEDGKDIHRLFNNNI